MERFSEPERLDEENMNHQQTNTALDESQFDAVQNCQRNEHLTLISVQDQRSCSVIPVM